VRLLSYWLVPDQSWLWVISGQRRAQPLPPWRWRIEKPGPTSGDDRRFDGRSRLGAATRIGDNCIECSAAGGQWTPLDARDHRSDCAPTKSTSNPRARRAQRALLDRRRPGEIAPSLATLTTERPVARGRRGCRRCNAPAHEPEFPALAYAAAEMSRVAAHFAPDAVTRLEREHASPAAYTAAQPDAFAYVHFTAHATTNLESPLDSVVVLSGPQDRFKLYARDVALLRLHAELVTVSACRSAGDHAYSGDGLVGFSWAFMKAGARHVIAGLWDIDDASTPQLMDRLYAGIAAGHTPGRALRDAKRCPDRGRRRTRRSLPMGGIRAVHRIAVIGRRSSMTIGFPFSHRP
jgi:hypothetical protein